MERVVLMNSFLLPGIVLLVLLLVLVVIFTYNGLVRIRNQAEEAFSTMDVYLKKRFDLIPNLVESVKGYAAHEQATLKKVVEARNNAAYSKSRAQRQENENMLSGTLKSLFALAENYPELKADRGFLDLQNSLSEVETEIAKSRQYYNGVVKAYNNKILQFPSNLFAMMFGFKSYAYFGAQVEERRNVSVKF